MKQNSGSMLVAIKESLADAGLFLLSKTSLLKLPSLLTILEDFLDFS